MSQAIKVNATHYVIMKIRTKREPQQIASNHSSDIDFKHFTKLYEKYTKEPYSFLVNIQLYHQTIYYDLGRTHYKMSIREKVKAINNEIDQKQTSVA